MVRSVTVRAAPAVTVPEGMTTESALPGVVPSLRSQLLGVPHPPEATFQVYVFPENVQPLLMMAVASFVLKRAVRPGLAWECEIVA